MLNPLAFPFGVPPGFNPKHFAAGKKYNDSGVCRPDSKVFLNLASSLVGVTGGTVGSILLRMSDFGPSLNFGSASNVTNTDLGTHATTGAAPTAFTFAAIIKQYGTSVSFTAPLIVYQYNGALTQCLAWTNNPVVLALQFGNTGTNYISSTIQIPNSLWSFCAASYDGVTANFVVRSLSTGSPAFTQAVAGSKSLAASPRTILGGFGGVANNCNSDIAAVMYAENNYLSLPQLKQWADRPWDFWYPPTQSSLVKQTFALSSGNALGAPQRPLMGVGQ